MFRRDLLRRHEGERVFFRLTSGTQLSGVVLRVTGNHRHGEVELGRVRVVTPGPGGIGSTWTDAAPGSDTGFERAHIDYWQIIREIIEPAPQQVTG